MFFNCCCDAYIYSLNKLKREERQKAGKRVDNLGGGGQGYAALGGLTTFSSLLDGIDRMDINPDGTQKRIHQPPQTHSNMNLNHIPDSAISFIKPKTKLTEQEEMALYARKYETNSRSNTYQNEIFNDTTNYSNTNHNFNHNINHNINHNQNYNNHNFKSSNRNHDMSSSQPISHANKSFQNRQQIQHNHNMQDKLKLLKQLGPKLKLEMYKYRIYCIYFMPFMIVCCFEF